MVPLGLARRASRTAKACRSRLRDDGVRPHSEHVTDPRQGNRRPVPEVGGLAKYRLIVAQLPLAHGKIANDFNGRRIGPQAPKIAQLRSSAIGADEPEIAPRLFHDQAGGA